MARGSRYPMAVLLVLAVLSLTVAVMAMTRPTHARDERAMIDFSKREYHSPAAVRRAFAAHGVDLRYRLQAGQMTILAVDRSWTADALQVVVAPRRGKASWGPRLERYDARFDNILVTYGGKDRALLALVKAAVTDLR